MLPPWYGAPARLAEFILALAALTASAQLLGSLGLFRGGPVLITAVGAGAAMAMLGTARSPSGEPRARGAAGGRGEVIAAAAATLLVAVQWASHAALALHRGMTQVDTLEYHAPFAVRFVQNGRLAGLGGIARPVYQSFPQNSELVHALAILPFGRDWLSPLLNLVWALLVLLAAWCIGAQRGAGALCVLGAVLVLGLPTLTGSQPGQASNDVVVLALLLSAVALLLHGGLAPVPTTLAGVAAGLALSTKLTSGAVVAVISVGLIVHAVRVRRPSVALGWCIALSFFGSYWLLRDWVTIGSPVPWVPVRLGVVSFPAPLKESGASVVRYIGDGGVWRHYYLPGLARALGRAWPLVLAFGLGAGVFARRRRQFDGWLALTVLVAAVAYAFTPLTAEGRGAAFLYDLRFLTPALLLGVMLGCRALSEAKGWLRRAAWIGMASIVALNATASNYEDTPAWPARGILPAVLAVSTITVVAAVVMRWHRASTVRVAIAGALVLAMAGTGGWLVQRDYFEHRYKNTEVQKYGRIYAYFRDVRRTRVIQIGFSAGTYPMFGLDLSNRVAERATFRPASRCVDWRHLVAQGGYRYVVLVPQGYGLYTVPPERWFTSDPAVRVVSRGPAGLVVLRVDGQFDPRTCT